MSTPQTDAHNEGQQNRIIEFDGVLKDWFEGDVDYDEVIDYLQRAREDEDVSATTYRLMENMWSEAKNLDEMWQKEEGEKWDALRRDQGGDNVW